MKKLFLLTPLLFVVTMLTAQSNHSSLFDVDNNASPNKVYVLGTDPQFPFLSGLTSPSQVALAMRSSENRRKYPRQMKELDNIMKDLGYENGAADVPSANISRYTVEPGTTGNMGNGGNRYSYTVMQTKKPQKAWKVTARDGSQSVALMNACGNAFYSNSYSGYKPKCDNVPVAVNAEPKEITLTETSSVKKKTYVYYKKGCPCRDCAPGWNAAAYKEGILSRPLLVKTEKVAVPQTYKVSASSTGNALICKGKTTEVTADLVVEKDNEYTGYMPGPKKEYIEVTRREYKRLMKQKYIMADVMQRPARKECETCKY